MGQKYATKPGTLLYYSLDGGSSYTQLAGIHDFKKMPMGKRNKINITQVDQMLTVGTRTGNTTSTSPTITTISDTSDLAPGMIVTGAGIPAGSHIVSKTSGSITMDQNATATATGITMTFVAVDWGIRYRAGRKDPSTFEFVLSFDEDNIAQAALMEGQLVTWKILYSTQAYQTFTGYIDSEPEMVDEGEEELVNVSIQVSGNVTQHKAGT